MPGKAATVNYIGPICSSDSFMFIYKKVFMAADAGIAIQKTSRISTQKP
jgi:hypothetical protein